MPGGRIRSMLDIPMEPPAEWFSPPEDGIPTDRRITIEPSGRVYGYIAGKGIAHVGHQGRRTAPIGEGALYDMAHQGVTLTASGEEIKTAVIPGGIAHAGPGLNAQEAADVYANTGNQLMRVRYGEDENGLWFAGALFPDVNELDIVKIRASGLSGDWRWQQAWRKTDSGKAAFVGACLVNIPGIPVPSKTTQIIAASSGKPLSLVASYFPEADEYIDEGELMSDSLTADGGSCANCTCGKNEDLDDTAADVSADDAGSTDEHDGDSPAEDSGEPDLGQRLSVVEERQATVDSMVADLHADLMNRKRSEQAAELFAAFDE